MPSMKAAVVEQFGKPLVIEPIAVRGSIAGTRRDLAAAIAVTAAARSRPLGDISDAFERMKAGRIDCRGA